MIEEEKVFIKLELRDIQLGKPLRWAIYNGDKQVIYRKGQVIHTQAEAEAAFTKGGYRQVVVETMEPPPAPPGGPSGGELRAAASRSPSEPVDSQEAARAAQNKSQNQTYTFEASKIKIGDPIQLQASADQPRYVVRLIGYLKNRGLIVSQPEINGEIIMLRDGQSFVGRFFSGQSAFAFSTAVTRQTSVPYPHMHLAYPREVRGVSVRKSARIDVSVIAAVESKDGKMLAPGKICNLSVAGAGLRTKRQIAAKGDEILLKFKVSMLEIDTFLVFNAEVCSVQETAEEPDTPFLYGLKFVEIDNAMQLSLAAYVYYKLQEESGG